VLASRDEVGVTLRDRILGCIVGGAIGDALGAPFEGQPGASPAKVWGDTPGRLTDDTQLTLATCEAIASAGRADPTVIADTFLSWFRARRFTGLGASTLKALRDLEVGAHWALAGRRGERAAGNGAAMRAAPLAFCTDPQTEQGRRLIRDVCRITHHNDEAYVGALAVVLAIRAMCPGSREGTSSLLADIAAKLPDTSVRERIVTYAQVSPSVPLAELATQHGASGYVAESVPFALFAAQRMDDLGFAGMLEQVISAGGDTDTNASLAGQVAGTKLGLSGLPGHLVAELEEADLVFRITVRFADVAINGS
jgi:ADP-ribosylglycohydrolase